MFGVVIKGRQVRSGRLSTSLRPKACWLTLDYSVSLGLGKQTMANHFWEKNLPRKLQLLEQAVIGSQDRLIGAHVHTKTQSQRHKTLILHLKLYKWKEDVWENRFSPAAWMMIMCGTNQVLLGSNSINGGIAAKKSSLLECGWSQLDVSCRDLSF